MEDIQSLRREIKELAERRSTRRYPAALRERIVVQARAEIATGVSVWQTARRLDMGQGTLQRFLADARPPSPSFVPVHVVDEPQPASAIVVRAPRGLVIEGLVVEDLAALVRGLS